MEGGAEAHPREVVKHSVRAGAERRFDHRTKTERRATILLPNPVAAHDAQRDVMDGYAKIFKENRTVRKQAITIWNGRKRITNALL